ncbi:MAG: 1-(5-phosphoribosyl)-5-((5-phosphoribosylamino)methylideneamino)imidazole-4-carboxamide isomerase, partial [Thermoleophilia bacterium]|nr:1-(5-phosphoribosyl)-5-((5-phosphoribosylamino)methylideneamino)imidazole-4-carboxamide isomerase [Thermoleophilia bacterium]
MILYPAIDLKDGACVRLLRGDMDRATVFGTDPAAQARAFAAAGAGWLHLVDLNGAFAGRPVNAAAVEAILAAVSVPVQLGGGIRDLGTVEGWLARGVSRVILGTAAVENPALVRGA